ncbi:glycosyl hydrolase family 28 protein [Sinomicrobium soli]|uniref:glycosyl hydrolase family 28 protein n=1 Tax=Sinomicrobium sp. N-1-3-6 TaxID=2219864 RepID=UPI000DCCDF39|nr:glycosyl hydrolase family 28 protein [Sinomicrobium sp. N-1-3-6]RAV30341.1 glycoside hydrolase [Sinomicrobium sp. N-1-3-6]
MNRKQKLSVLVILSVFFFKAHAFQKSDKLEVYPVDDEIRQSMHNPAYTVKVRTPGGKWQDVFTYKVRVDLDDPQEASLAYFDFEGTVEVSVTGNTGKIEDVAIRPFSCDISHKQKKNTITFTLDQPRKLSVEFNGDRFHNLHLFANGMETSGPDPSDPDVIYFGPGIHTPGDDPAKIYRIPENKTVYIAGGAVVRTTFVASDASNVKLMGRGIIDGGKYGLKIHNTDRVSIKDLIFMNIRSYTVFGGNSNHIHIDNIKSISSDRYSDGIDLMSCNEVNISNVFLRNSDDCLAFYGHRWDYYGGAKNYNITNAVLWADVAHPVFIGIHGNPAEVDTLQNFSFRDIDILEHDEDSRIFQGCMAINSGDNTLVKEVSFEDIRVEDFEEGQLFNLRIVKNGAFNKVPGRGIEDISFKNIHYDGKNGTPSVIEGFDADRRVRNVSFENVIINGEKLMEGSQHIKILGHTDRIEFH